MVSDTSDDTPKSILLTSGSVLVRPFWPTDAAAFTDAVNESVPELGGWMSWAHPDYALEEAEAWITLTQARLAAGEAYDFAIVGAQDRLLGGVALNQFQPIHRMANLGYWVRSGATGHGVAPLAARLMAEFAFEVLAYARLEILVGVGNARSCRVAEKVGAVREGVLRNRLRIHDRQVDAVMYGWVPEQMGLRTP